MYSECTKIVPRAKRSKVNETSFMRIDAIPPGLTGRSYEGLCDGPLLGNKPSSGDGAHNVQRGKGEIHSCMMLDIGDLEFFKVVSEAPSLAAASRELKVSAPAVSQRVSLLERRVGIPLFDRKDQKHKLTDAGQLLATRGRIILSSMNSLLAELENRRGGHPTPMRVLVPMGSAGWFISQQTLGFIRMHPETKLQVTRIDKLPGDALKTDNWDVIIYPGKVIEGLHSERLEQLKLSSLRLWLVASPEYINQHGMPLTPESLKSHSFATNPFITQETDNGKYHPCIDWQLLNSEGQAVHVKIPAAYSSNDYGLLQDWCASGMGIIARTEISVYNEVMAGNLVRILPDWEMPEVNIMAIYRRQSLYLQACKEFVEGLRAVMQDRERLEWQKFRFDGMVQLY